MRASYAGQMKCFGGSTGTQAESWLGIGHGGNLGEREKKKESWSRCKKITNWEGSPEEKYNLQKEFYRREKKEVSSRREQEVKKIPKIFKKQQAPKSRKRGGRGEALRSEKTGNLSSGGALSRKDWPANQPL